jgi:membrane-associated phospholipid phosphatase
MDVTRPLHWLYAHRHITEYVSKRLLIGLVLCIACLYGFAKLVDEVIIERESELIDNIVAHELHAAAQPGTTTFFLIITEMGAQALLVICFAVGVYFALRRRWLRLGVWVAALAGGQALNTLLKTWIARPRPAFADPLATALYYSFPSGHSMMSLIMYGLLAYFVMIGVRSAWLRVPITAGLIGLILLIGVSRMYLGVHYLTDVLAGFVVGGLWLAFCITAMNFILERRPRE